MNLVHVEGNRFPVVAPAPGDRHPGVLSFLTKGGFVA
jgi:hypothetical protein